jgi:hypothetical protein
MSKVGIVIAWRQGEADLDATIESARRSVGKLPAAVYAVEDKDRQGPARTRHKGIEAASDCDVILVADSHMRFDGKTLAKLAKAVRADQTLACPTVYHNTECAMKGGKYCGARIVYKAKNGREQHALCAKWSRSDKPGQRGAVMGGCYAFRRDWYYQVGAPWAALPGWGCDEESLSIAAWLSGQVPVALGCVAAHRYRERPPWPVMSDEFAAAHASRMALIHCVVSEVNARNELTAWQRAWVPEGIPPCTTPEAERFRLALLQLPRTWRQWRASVCEPDEIDGQQREQTTATPNEAATLAPVRNPTTVLHGVRCSHCGTVHDPHKLPVTHTYPNGNRRHVCPICRNPFVSVFRATA